jgi:RNA-binding protein NOB1
LSKVIAAAKKTGDYSVLSRPDLCVLALTYNAHEDESKRKVDTDQAGDVQPVQEQNLHSSDPKTPLDEVIAKLSIATDEGTTLILPPTASETTTGQVSDDSAAVQLQVKVAEADQSRDLAKSTDTPESTGSLPTELPAESSHPTPVEVVEPLYSDPSSEDDGEGEWITPTNVATYKAREHAALPGSSTATKKGKRAQNERMEVACMTSDFAVQNVLLHMGLDLVDIEGKRIRSVKSWVLRCHACFKLCKDPTKKFCPSCGNPTLLRTSITTTAATTTSAPTVQVHLKPKFQYRNRGTIYSIPTPKPGSAKGGSSGTPLILREDQVEFQRAVKREDARQRKEEKRLEAAVAAGKGTGSWNDPDWVPEILLGKSTRHDSGLPTIGYGRKNPNERRKTKR